MFTPSLQCAATLLNVTLRSLVLAVKDSRKEEQKEEEEDEGAKRVEV